MGQSEESSEHVHQKKRRKENRKEFSNGSFEFSRTVLKKLKIFFENSPSSLGIKFVKVV